MPLLQKLELFQDFRNPLFFYFLFTKAITAKIIAAAAIDNPRIAKSYAEPLDESSTCEPDFIAETSFCREDTALFRAETS